MGDANNGNDRQNIALKIAELRSIASDVIKFSIVAYAIGFVVVNSSLLEYGYMSFNIATTRYFLAGLLLIFFCFMALLTIYICRHFIMTGGKLFVYGMGLYVQLSAFNYLIGLNPIRKNILYGPPWLFQVLYIAIVLVPFISFFLITLIKTARIRPFIELFLLLLPISFHVLYGTKEYLYLMLIVLIVFVFKNTLLLNQKLIAKEFPINDLNTPRMIIFRLIGIIAIPVLFGTQIYMNIDRMKGGGAPLLASVIIQNDEKNAILAETKGFSIDFNKALLILENGNSIILGIENSKGDKSALEIPIKNILGIRYIRAKKK